MNEKLTTLLFDIQLFALKYLKINNCMYFHLKHQSKAQSYIFLQIKLSQH